MNFSSFFDVPERLRTWVELSIAQRTSRKSSGVSFALSVGEVASFVRMSRHTESAIKSAQVVLHDVWVLRKIDLVRSQALY